jgi:hypothetical protein
MEEENTLQRSPEAEVIGTKSWVAYLGLILLAVVLFGLVPFAFMWNEIVAAIVLVAAALIVTYRFFQIRNVQIYIDDVGTWVSRGVLPWQKGITGVKWRDMDEAIFHQNFWTWITRSNTIRVGHRFTKSNEIVETHIGGGQNTVARINGRLQQLIRDGKVN